MKIIGLEEHWCPRELFDKEGTPGYESIESTKILFPPDKFNTMCDTISNIGDSRIKMMDSIGLTMQVLSLCSANMEILPDDQAIYYSTLSNDILAEGIRKNPTRLRGFAALPTGNPEAAAKELERCKNIGGFVGAIINGHINGHYLDEPKFEPILAAAENLNMPLYIHPAVPPKAVIDTYYKMDDKYAQTVLSSGGWGWHIETGVHVLRLIASGAFDRHPNLKIIIGHLGEGLPFFMDRLYNATKGTLKKAYPEYLKENIYYTTSGFHDPDLFEYVLKKVGDEHLMFSTDFPFMPPQNEMEFIRTVNVSANIREKICSTNAEHILNICSKIK